MTGETPIHTTKHDITWENTKTNILNWTVKAHLVFSDHQDGKMSRAAHKNINYLISTAQLQLFSAFRRSCVCSSAWTDALGTHSLNWFVHIDVQAYSAIVKIYPHFTRQICSKGWNKQYVHYVEVIDILHNTTYILRAAAFIHLPCFNLLSQCLTAFCRWFFLVYQLRRATQQPCSACCSSCASSINEAQASCSACFSKPAANRRSTRFL